MSYNNVTVIHFKTHFPDVKYLPKVRHTRTRGKIKQILLETAALRRIRRSLVPEKRFPLTLFSKKLNREQPQGHNFQNTAAAQAATHRTQRTRGLSVPDSRPAQNSRHPGPPHPAPRPIASGGARHTGETRPKGAPLPLPVPGKQRSPRNTQTDLHLALIFLLAPLHALHRRHVAGPSPAASPQRTPRGRGAAILEGPRPRPCPCPQQEAAVRRFVAALSLRLPCLWLVPRVPSYSLCQRH